MTTNCKRCRNEKWIQSSWTHPHSRLNFIKFWIQKYTWFEWSKGLQNLNSDGLKITNKVAVRVRVERWDKDSNAVKNGSFSRPSESMWLSHFRSWVKVVPRDLNYSTAVTVLFMMVSKWGECRGVSPEVHDHLHCFDRVQLQVVKTAPDSQLLNLLSVSRLVAVLDEADQCGVNCKLQELYRGVFWCAVVRVHGEEQWGENIALRSSCADRTGAGCVFPQPHQLLPVCQEAVDPLADGGGHRELS